MLCISLERHFATFLSTWPFVKSSRSAEFAAAVMLSFNSIWRINLSNIYSESYKAELRKKSCTVKASHLTLNIWMVQWIHVEKTKKQMQWIPFEAVSKIQQRSAYSSSRCVVLQIYPVLTIQAHCSVLFYDSVTEQPLQNIPSFPPHPKAPFITPKSNWKTVTRQPLK